jgi:hypothetical protein
MGIWTLGVSETFLKGRRKKLKRKPFHRQAFLLK